jgi:hypothetical protein
MDAVEIERGESRGAAAELQYPRRYSTRGAIVPCGYYSRAERQRTGG